MNSQISALSWHDRAKALEPRTQAFIGEALCGLRVWRHVHARESRQWRGACAGGRVRYAGHRRSRGRGARCVRVGRVGEAVAEGAQEVLQRFAALIHANLEELALLETLDTGKPIRDSLNVDVPATVNCIQWFAEAVDKIYDEVAPTDHSALALITREPLGVVGAIVPWNFPMIMAAWKIGPILAAGNSLVLKPSEKSPLSAIRLAQLASEAGIPDGVFNVVPGLGMPAGKALALHMDVDGIAFTGSTATGRSIMQYAGQSNLKRVSLECGGKSPNIVLADYDDLDRAATAAAFRDLLQSG